MSAIMIKCPETGRDISIGIDTDSDSFESLSRVASDIKCPECGKTHEWGAAQAWLQERERTQRPG